ncbi:acyl-CoA dehydrogenase family protein, partial [Clostridium botulinum D/C]
MDFNLTREQQYVKQMVKEFVENEVKPMAAETDATGVFPMENYKKLAKYGVIGLPYPKEYGGTGGDYLSYILAVEEVSKACGTTGIAFSVNTSLCCGAIYQNGTEDQKKK